MIQILLYQYWIKSKICRFKLKTFLHAMLRVLGLRRRFFWQRQVELSNL